MIGAAAVATVLVGRGGGSAGLALSCAFFATRSLSYLVRGLSGLEQQLNSLDRMAELIFTPLEPDTTATVTASVTAKPSESASPPSTNSAGAEPAALALAKWPADSLLVMDRATLHYGSGSGGFREVSLRLEPGERFGLCGRTGSGKSSVAKALCRLVELSAGSVR